MQRERDREGEDDGSAVVMMNQRLESDFFQKSNTRKEKEKEK